MAKLVFFIQEGSNETEEDRPDQDCPKFANLGRLKKKILLHFLEGRQVLVSTSPMIFYSITQ